MCECSWQPQTHRQRRSQRQWSSAVTLAPSASEATGTLPTQSADADPLAAGGPAPAHSRLPNVRHGPDRSQFVGWRHGVSFMGSHRSLYLQTDGPERWYKQRPGPIALLPLVPARAAYTRWLTSEPQGWAPSAPGAMSRPKWTVSASRTPARTAGSVTYWTPPPGMTS